MVNAFQTCWESRSQRCITNGRKFGSYYEAEIKFMSNEYLQKKGKLLSANIIKNALHEKYTDRYDIHCMKSFLIGPDL